MRNTIIALAFACALAGCGGTAGCNDSGIKDTIVEMVAEDIDTAVWGRELIEKGRVSGFEVTGVKTTGRDSELDAYTCEANFEFEFDGRVQSREIEYELAWVEDEYDTEVTLYEPDAIKRRVMALATTAGR